MTRQIQKSKCYAGILLSAMAFAAVPAAAQAVHGTGTTNTIPLWTSSNRIGNSVLTQSGGNLVTSGGITAASFNGATLSLTGALTGNSGSFSGGITAASFTGSGSGLSNVNAATLSGISASGFAQLAASSNTFSGTVSAATINSNNPFQFGGTPVLSITFGSLGNRNNLFVGPGAGNNTGGGGDSNTGIGSFALFNATGNNNTAAGTAALEGNTTGSANTAAGVEALVNNTTGGENAAVGWEALVANTTGSDNTAVGVLALNGNATGNGNTAVGYGTLFGGGVFTNATGSNNTAIGTGAGSSFTTSESNNIDIGNAGVAGESNVIRIGSAQSAAYIAGITGVTTGSSSTSTVLVDSNGQLGTIASSRRYKEDIYDMGAASDGLLRLRPVTFRYKKPYADGSKPIQYGLIAEEVAEVYPELVVNGKDGHPETVQYYKLDAMLLNEVEKLARLHAADEAEIAKLRSELAEQRKEVQDQQATMKQLQEEIRVVGLTLAQIKPAGGNEHASAALAPEESKPTARK